jgi:hypothetical protein
MYAVLGVKGNVIPNNSSAGTLTIPPQAGLSTGNGNAIINIQNGISGPIALGGKSGDVVPSGVNLNGTAMFPDGSTQQGVIITVTSNQTVDIPILAVDGYPIITDLAATAIVTRQLFNIGFHIVFSPAVLIKFIPSCDGGDEKFYIMINEAKFN